MSKWTGRLRMKGFWRPRLQMEVASESTSGAGVALLGTRWLDVGESGLEHIEETVVNLRRQLEGLRRRDRPATRAPSRTKAVEPLSEAELLQIEQIMGEDMRSASARRLATGGYVGNRRNYGLVGENTLLSPQVVPADPRSEPVQVNTTPCEPARSYSSPSSHSSCSRSDSYDSSSSDSGSSSSSSSD